MLVAAEALAAADPPAAALDETVSGLELEHAVRGRASAAIPTVTRTRALVCIVVLSRLGSGIGPEYGEDGVAGFRTAQRRGAAGLVDEHGGDQDGADGDALPERLDADDDEPGLEHRGDEETDDGPEDRPLAAEDGGASDHDGGDDVEVRQRLSRDRGRPELGQR